jgi:hypothetical protein
MVVTSKMSFLPGRKIKKLVVVPTWEKNKKIVLETHHNNKNEDLASV